MTEMSEPRPEEESVPESDVDPFSHHLSMPIWRWILTLFFGIVLFPLRALSILLIVCFTFVIFSVVMWGLSEEEVISKPFTGWRKMLRTYILIPSTRLIAFLSGFVYVPIKGELAKVEVAPILVAAPHSSFFDTMIGFSVGEHYVVSRAENATIPLLGVGIRSMQALFVSRERPESRQMTAREIIRRSTMHYGPNEPRWPHLIIFPEGSTSNRKALLKFKPGAFNPGCPVQPVLIRYPNKYDTITWTWNQNFGPLMALILTMCQPFVRAEIEYLPVYYPNEEEKKDARLFADNVRDVMCRALKVPKCDSSYEQARNKFRKEESSKSK